MATDLPDDLLSDESDGGGPLSAIAAGAAGAAGPEARPPDGRLPGEVVGFTSADEAPPPAADATPWEDEPAAAPAPTAALLAVDHAALPEVVIVGGEAAPGLPAAPPPYTPRPRPPIRPERTPEGHYRTDGILIERVAGRSCFVTIHPPQAAPQRVYVDRHALERLLLIAGSLNWEQGKLWRALADIPLERPLPSRRLEEELKALLTTFAADLRD